uniref:WD repeat-containing protein 18 n=1 Tax=Gadus morhua TaxID=8049 RepID=A0A8C4ZPL6_GADMO
MSAPMEVIVSTDSSSLLWNCTVSDLHSGANLVSYRGGNTSARGLAVLDDRWLLGAQLGKNFINVWEIQRKDQLLQRMVCPGVVTCLTAAPNGLFLAAGIAEALYLWEVSTGGLLAVLNRHYQDVSCVKFTDDSSHLITGGKDNLALVWRLASVVQLDQGCSPEPLHVLSRHSLPVTDLHCGLMGPQARLATASLDQTVKLWELGSGELLLSILFDVSIMSVTLDPCEYFLFCGGSDGNIFQVSLCSQSLSRDKTFQSESDGNQVFKGHRNLVSCLSVSMDGTLLLSGSHDETMRLWDVQSRQNTCVKWCVSATGQVTTCSIMAAPANMLVPLGASATPLPRLSRHLASSQHAEGPDSGDVCLRLGLHTQEEESYLQKAEKLFSTMTAITDKRVGDEDGSRVRLAELEEEVRTLKKVNKDLYSFSAHLLT